MSHIPDDLETTLETPNPHDEPAPQVAKSNASSLSVVDPAQYEVTKEIGQGGMGRVILAKDQRLSRQVAIKELLPVGREAIPRFIREAQVTARLQHPSILPIYELGRWPNGKPFYAMKLIQGKSLGDTLPEYKTMEARLALLPRILDACDAMAYAHAEGVIHRDLKPDNIMLGPFGETIVIDWGLAKDLTHLSPNPSPFVGEGDSAKPNRERSPKLTVAGNIIGTPAYMPLEQAHGQPLDARADVYSLGAILYETLAGQAPYEGKSTEELLLSLHQHAPIPLQERAPRAPKELLAIVEKAMARNKEQRYPSAKELASDLRRFQEGQLVAAYQYTKGERLSRWMKQHKTSIALASASIVALLSLGVVSYISIQRERDVAVGAKQEALASKKQETKRADELVSLQAQGALERDPSSALTWLSQLSPGSPLWREARIIAADANERGLSSSIFAGDSPANSMDLSPNQELLAVAFDDSLWIEDLSQKKRLYLTGHSAETIGVLFSPDGKSLASADRSGQVFQWDVSCVKQKNDDSCRTLLYTHEGRATALAFSPDSARLASGGEDGIVQVAGASCHGHSDLIRRIIFSANGAWLASASYDGTLRLWDPSLCSKASKEAGTGLPSERGGKAPSSPERDDAREVFIGHSGEVISFVLSPDSQTLYSVGQDQTLRAWSVSTKKDSILLTHTSPLTALDISRDGRTLVVGAEDGAMFAVDPTLKPKVAKKVAARTKIVCPEGAKPTPEGGCVCEGGRFASADKRSCQVRDIVNSGDVEPKLPSDRKPTLPSDRKSKTKDVTPLSVTTSEGKESPDEPVEGARELPGHDEAVLIVMLFDEGKWVASAGRDKQVRLYSLSTQQEHSFSGHQDRVTSLAYTKSSNALLSSSWDGTVRRWSLERLAQQYKLSGEPVTGAAWLQGEDTPRIVGASGSRLSIWGMDGALKKIENNDLISTLAVSRAQDRFAVGASNGSIKLFGAKDLVAQRLTDADTKLPAVSMMSFSEDGSMLVAGAGNKLWLWDGSAAKVIATLESDVTALAISPDKSYIAATDGTGPVYLWSISGKSMKKTPAHGGYVNAVAFSADSKRLASGGEDAAICLFWVGKDASCEKLSGHSLGVSALVFSPDGAQLLSGSFDRSLRLWDLTKKTSRALPGHRGVISSLQFLQGGQTILSVANDESAYLWDVSTGQKRALRTNEKLLSASASPGESKILLLSRDGSLQWFQNDTPIEESSLRAWIKSKQRE